MAIDNPESTPELSPDEHRKLERSFIKGVAWTGISKWSVQIFAWVSTVITARLLTPDDYGLMAMAYVYLGLIVLVSEFGLGSAVVMLRHLSEDQIAQLYTLSVFLGVVGFLASCLVALPLGGFFDAPDLPDVVIVMGIGFVITAFQTVPSSLLQKEHRFKEISVIAAAKALAQCSCVVVLAYLGFRYWSLVIGSLVGSVLGSVLTCWVKPHRLAKPRPSSLTTALNFSWRMLATRLSWYAYTNVDRIIAGRMLGQQALGSYSIAWELANAPLEKVTALVCSVTPAFYSAVKESPETLRRYLLKPVEVIALVIFPAMLGMSLVAEDMVFTLLGAKWEAAIPILQLLSFYACVRAIVPLFPQVLMVVGEEKFVMWNGIKAVFILTTAFIIGSRWGTSGIAAAWVIAYPLSAIPLYRKVCRKIGLTHREFFHALRPAISGSVLMSAAVAGVKCLLDGRLGPVAGVIVQTPPWSELPHIAEIAVALQWSLDGHFGHMTRLAVQVVCGAFAYGLIVWVFHRGRLLAFRRGLGAIRQ